jgi:hypothetical protein
MFSFIQKWWYSENTNNQPAQIINNTEEDWEDIVPADASESREHVPSAHNGSILYQAGFTKEHILEMANYAKLSYCNDPIHADYATERSKLIDAGYKTFENLQNDGWKILPVYSAAQQKAKSFGVSNQNDVPAAYIFTRGNKVVIAYHGTRSRQDVATDINAAFTIPDYLPNGYRVHAGFSHALEESWDDLYVKLQQHLKQNNLSINDVEFDITGHSMGGALAKLAALRLNQCSGINKIKVATFGDPRVLASETAELYNKELGHQTLRIVQHYRDPVPMVGPGIAGYKHVGMQLCVATDNNNSVHKLNGYFNVLKNMEVNQFGSNDNVSIFYPISMLLQTLNTYTIGLIHTLFNKVFYSSNRDHLIENNIARASVNYQIAQQVNDINDAAVIENYNPSSVVNLGHSIQEDSITLAFSS